MMKMVLAVLLGMVAITVVVILAGFCYSREYGRFILRIWSGMTSDYKIVLVVIFACLSFGALIGALIGGYVFCPQQASTSHTQLPEPSPIGMTHSGF